MHNLAELRDLKNLEQLSDAEVARRICCGEPALFELIMRRYNRRLFRIARGILGVSADAEDAVQAAYVSAYFKLRQFRGPDGFAGWLCRIATNEALMRRRSRMRSGISIPPEGLADVELAMTNEPSAQAGPEAQLHGSELRCLLEKAIDRLPEHFRTAFVLREVEQLSVAETAQCLSLEEATVKTRVHRARRLLQQALAGEISDALTGVYDFDGERCDRLVAGVFARINAG